MKNIKVWVKNISTIEKNDVIVALINMGYSGDDDFTYTSEGVSAFYTDDSGLIVTDCDNSLEYFKNSPSWGEKELTVESLIGAIAWFENTNGTPPSILDATVEVVLKSGEINRNRANTYYWGLGYSSTDDIVKWRYVDNEKVEVINIPIVTAKQPSELVVHPNLGYEAWLSSQPRNFINDVLGKEKAARFISQGGKFDSLLGLSAMNELGIQPIKQPRPTIEKQAEKEIHRLEDHVWELQKEIGILKVENLALKDIKRESDAKIKSISVKGMYNF